LVDATTQLKQFAIHEAEFHSLPPLDFLAVINCESGFNPDALGDYGTSYGIGQFHHLSDWGMTKEQSYDPFYSIARMALAWSDGMEYRWSCARMLAAGKLSPNYTKTALSNEDSVK
jgi:hypothetical protein